MRNVEWKAIARNNEYLEAIARILAEADEPIIQKQEDIFFYSTVGRMKLRNIEGAESSLVIYNRSDITGAKVSEYTLLPVPDSAAARNFFSNAYGVRAIVRKSRKIYLIGSTRVHLDTVEGLGDFIELEVVIDESQTELEATKIANDLAQEFEIKCSDFIEGAYVDLILKKGPAANGKGWPNSNSASFGTPTNWGFYQTIPSAYAIIAKGNLVAFLKTEEGYCLPGTLVGWGEDPLMKLRNHLERKVGIKADIICELPLKTNEFMDVVDRKVISCSKYYLAKALNDSAYKEDTLLWLAPDSITTYLRPAHLRVLATAFDLNAFREPAPQFF